MHKSMRHLVADDQTELSYRVVGDGPQAVVLLHGWMATGRIFDRLIASLDLEGMRLLIPDLRGAGASSASRGGYGLPRLGRDVLAIADAEDAERFVLVGHSMGGQLAQWIACEAPERVVGQLLMCPVPAVGQPMPAALRWLFHESPGDAEKLASILEISSLQLPDEARRETLNEALSLSPSYLRGTFETWSRGGFADRLMDIRCPTLVLTTDDPYFTRELLAGEVQRRIRGARLVHVAGAGHFPLLEQPEETASVVMEFLSGLKGQGGTMPPPSGPSRSQEGRLQA
ncbi:MAG TPA: alpha/beta hydrolase [Myxococcaceae bacterium]|nr:alpha/beta hydrolase [Myxococcaceae bacterium]